ncbi:IclR family transcriptional regulator [Chelatococcus sambhunathii]|uniref:IclR family transcriptional regulator n=1 Tax=Chelatococcus sambhunathii TaxID=363953 RepID=A0ABU1DKP7_9HYPH|nr:IclR family transcriptional regulator [Chelatococcus sambhunathii]MDR4308711.1 IclR family transcriptional regulator [Chelatococcus sambhunathii]
MRRGDAGPSSVAERILLLLEAVAGREEPATLAELTAAMGLAKATVHRLASLLVELRYLERTPDGKRYAVGARFAGAAAGALRSTLAWGPRRAVLRELVSRLNETCNITALDGGELVYLDRVESEWPLQIRLSVGSHVPLHCTASGKLFLAMSSAKIVRDLLSAGELPRHTPKTLVTPRDLQAALAQIRRDGFGTDDEEFIEGMTAVAVPIFSRSRTMIATVAVHGPKSRLPLSLALAHIPALREAANKLGAVLDGG